MPSRAIKITQKKQRTPAPLFWQRLAAFVAVAGVLFAAHIIFDGETSIRELLVGAFPALIAWYTGKLYAEPVPAVTERALMSLPPEKANLIIEKSLRNMQPDFAAAIMERVSQYPPQPKTSDGSQEKTQES